MASPVSERGPDALRSWNEVLTELEARVVAAEAALDAGGPLDDDFLAPFQAPADLPPLPEELFERAVTLMRRQNELEQRIQTSMGTISRELTSMAEGNRSGVSPFAETQIPRYFDDAV